MKERYTVPEVAEIIGVDESTVRRWTDAGKIKAFRFPEGVHRKIPYEDVVELLKRNGLPLDRIEIVENKRVLVIDDDEDLLDLIPEIIKDALGYEVKSAKDKLRGTYLLKEFKPHLIMLDNVPDNIDEDKFCDIVRNDPELKKTKIVKFTAANMTPEQAQEQGYDGLMQKPMDNGDIADYIKSIIG